MNKYINLWVNVYVGQMYNKPTNRLLNNVCDCHLIHYNNSIS